MEFNDESFKYLRQCGIKLSKSYFNLRLQSHPNYPSLVSLTDTMDELGISYNAFQINKEEIDNLSFPILAKTNQNKSNFEIIPTLQYFKENREVYINKWDGIAIIVSKKQPLADIGNKIFLKKEKSNDVILTLALIIALCIILQSFLIHFNTFVCAFTILNIFGILTSSLIILHKFGDGNRIIELLCSVKNIDHCKSVINSKHSQITKNLDAADIALTYFIGLLLYTVINNFRQFHETHSVLLFFCSLSILISLYSIYYQWKKIRSWCKMCLIVSVIVWLQFAVIGFQILKQGLSISNNTYALAAELMLCICAALCWWLLTKSLFNSKIERKTLEIKLLSWKRNPEIFKLLLKKQSPVDTTIPDNPFFIGNSDAPLHFTIISSPLCNPCSLVHKSLDFLYKKYLTNISFSVIFSITEVDVKKDKKTAIVADMLNSVKKGNELKILEDWYGTMSEEKWNQKYPTLPINKNTEYFIELYRQWNKQNKISFTPTIYINGYKMPAVYNIIDIESFIVEINEGLLNEEIKLTPEFDFLIPPKN